MDRRRRSGGWIAWLLLALAVGDWALLRTGTLRHPLWILAALVGSAILLLLGQLLALASAVLGRRRSMASAAGPALLRLGVATALCAGLLNWLLALQGFVVLSEGEAIPLHGGAHLQYFEGGPLSRIEEMDLLLALVELEFRAAGDGSFYPASLLEVKRGDGDPARFEIDPWTAGTAGPLRFFQGAFGFAPRIVLLAGERTVFDQAVPFTTERRGAAGISFEGRFEIEEEELSVAGAVDLTTLDAGLRGHAALRLEVVRGEELLGGGSLAPGHFAELRDGYRVGFAGLDKWSEIDVARRHYGPLVLAGSASALAGVILWGLAAWRRW